MVVNGIILSEFQHKPEVYSFISTGPTLIQSQVSTRVFFGLFLIIQDSMSFASLAVYLVWEESLFSVNAHVYKWSPFINIWVLILHWRLHECLDLKITWECVLCLHDKSHLLDLYCIKYIAQTSHPGHRHNRSMRPCTSAAPFPSWFVIFSS